MNELEKDRSELATGSIPKLVFNMGMPAILAQVINFLYSIIITIIVTFFGQ